MFWGYEFRSLDQAPYMTTVLWWYFIGIWGKEFYQLLNKVEDLVIIKIKIEISESLDLFT